MVLGSVALAGALGAFVFYGAYPSGSDDRSFDDIGRYLLAVATALVFGVASLVACVVVGVRETVPAGRRFATAVTIIVAALGIPFLVVSTIDAGRQAALDAIGLSAAVLLVVAAGAAIGAAAGIVPAGRAIALVGAAAAAVIAVDLARDVRGDEVAEQRRLASYEQTDAPLALIGGTSLEAGFVGWDLDSVRRSDDGDEVVVHYRKGDRGITLRFEADPEELDCRFPSCEELGRRADGEPIFGRPDPSLRDVYTDVWTDVDGGRWRIAFGRSFGPSGAVSVLGYLEPVDAATFVAGTQEEFNP